MMGDDEQITRQIMGNVSDTPWLVVLFYVFALGACGVAAIAFIRRIGQYRCAKPDQDLRRGIGRGLLSVFGYLTFHRQLRRDRYAGLAHMLVFYGFFVLFIGTCLVFLEHDTPLHFFYGRFYLVASLVIDVGGVALVIGLSMFVLRRVRHASTRILRHWWVGALGLLLLAISVTGFALEAARIAVDMPRHERWSAVGYSVAWILQGVGVHGESARRVHRFMWTVHAVLCIGFFALLPWRFFGHMVYGVVSLATRTNKPRTQLAGVSNTPLNQGDPVVSGAESGGPGATTWSDFGWHDLLQADACTTCGKCNEVCPAHAAGKPLHPREIVLGLRQAMHDRDRPLNALIDDDAIWSCTTCAACNDTCPVGIEVYDKIVEMRRGRIETGEVPAAAEQLFEATASDSNPFGKPARDRMNWAAGLNVPVAKEGEPIEWLYWVGCAGSFDPDGRAVTQAMVKILNHLNVNYRVLGLREGCTGDPSRRMGEEGLYLEQAQKTIDLLRSHRVQRLLTHCPHCYNTFANEYPQLGYQVNAEHHSQFLARMIHQSRLKLPRGHHQRLTFHDPCYLGRGNGQIRPPRDVLLSLPQVNYVEMPRHGRDSFCCGAGGGSMWLDRPGDERIENMRAQEAQATGASTVATGCPFCKSMLLAGCQSLETSTIEVKDLAELVVQAEGI